VSGASSLSRIGGLGASGRLRVSGFLGIAPRRYCVSRRFGVSRYAWVVLCAAIVWLGAPAVASASTGWGPPTRINSNNGLASISCPTSSFCVALGGQPVTDALIFQNGSWGSPSTIDSNGGLTSVSCSSDLYCVAVDNTGNEVTYDNGTWSAPAAIDTGGTGIGSVSCPASTTVPAPFCVAVDIAGNALIDQGGTWGKPTPVASGVLWVSVSCASASFCMTVGLGVSGQTLTGEASSYNGTSWSSPTTVASGGTFMDSVSCPSSSFCGAVASAFAGGSAEGVGYTWNGTWSSGQPLAASVTPGGFQGSISCTSASFCQAVYATPDAALFNGATWTVDSGIDNQGNLSSLSCPTQEFCEAVDFAGFALTFTGPPPVPMNVTPPSISGTPIVGKTLSLVHGTWSNPPIKSYSDQWLDCDPTGNACTPINKATNLTYKVQTTDEGHTIEVQESATNAGGTSASPATPSAPTSVVVPPVPKNTSVPTISGNTTVGQTLKESHATWTNGPVTYSYQWEDCNVAGTSCAAIFHATKQTYILKSVDVGHTLRVQEFATNAGGTSASPATSARTAVVQPLPTKPADFLLPVISGNAIAGQNLSTSTEGWSGTRPISYAYQWQRCTTSCSNIGGATGSSYTLTSADQNALVQVMVTARNVAGSLEATSLPVGPVTVSGPTITQIEAALQAILGAHGKNARIKSLLKHGGYSVSFDAPSAGELVISWHATPSGARSAKSRKPVLIASGRASFANAGTATVKIKLMGKGRSVLKHSKRLKLTEKSSFTPTGQPSTSASKSFSIRR
jgi:hypothetical protein